MSGHLLNSIRLNYHQGTVKKSAFYTIKVCVGLFLTVSWDLRTQLRTLGTGIVLIYLMIQKQFKRGVPGPLKDTVSAPKSPSRVVDRDEGVAEWNGREHHYP